MVASTFGSITANYAGTGLNAVIDETTILRYGNALKGLTIDQANLALSTTTLTNAEKQAVLVKAGLIKENEELTISEAALRIEKEAGSVADAKKLLESAGLVTAKQLEENATIKLTAAEIQEAMAKGRLSVEDAKVITSALGITGVNFGEKVSWDVLTASITKNTVAMLKNLAANPLTWIVATIAAVAALVKGYDKLIGRQEALARTRLEGLDENISKYDEEIKSLENLQEKLIDAKGNKTELAKIQKDLNAEIGETKGLLNGESKAWDITNGKIEARIELLKRQRKEEQRQKVNTSKELFNSNAYERKWLKDISGEDMREYLKLLNRLDPENTGSISLKGLSLKEQDLASKANGLRKENKEAWAKYWDEQIDIAYDVFEQTISDYEGEGGQSLIKNLISSAVKSGADLSEISDIVNSFVNNQQIQDAINTYWDSLLNPDVDSEAALKKVKDIFDSLIRKTPQLKEFFDTFYNNIVMGKDFVVKTTSETVKDTKKSAEDRAKAIEDLAEKEKDFAKNMAEAWKKEYFEQFKEDLEAHERELEKYSQKLELLDLGNDLFRETDYVNRMDNTANKFSTLQAQGEALRSEFERLVAITPKTADEANALADRVTKLGSQMRENAKATRESIAEINNLRVSAILSVPENQLKNLQRESDLYEKRLEVLRGNNGTGKYSSKYLFNSILPSLSDFEKKVKQKEKEDKQLIELEQQTQDTINKIVEDAAKKQSEENAKARAEERQKLIDDMEKTRKELNTKISQIGNDVNKQVSNDSKKAKDTISAAETDISNGVKAFGENIVNQAENIGEQIYDSIDKTSSNVVNKIRQSVQDAMNELDKLSSANTGSGAFGIDAVLGITHTTSNQKAFASGQKYAGVSGSCVYYVKARGQEITGKSYSNIYGNGSTFGQGTKAYVSDRSQFEANLVPGTVVSYDISQIAHNGTYGYGHVRIVEGYDAKTKTVYFSENYTGNQIKAQSLNDFLNNPYKSTSGKIPKAIGVVNPKRFAKGTDYHTGGLALTGDGGGRELGILPNGKVVMFGENGAELVDMPIGTQVIPHKETEEIVKYTGNITGKKVNRFAEGTDSSYKDFLLKAILGKVMLAGEGYDNMLPAIANEIRDYMALAETTDDDVNKLIEEISKQFNKFGDSINRENSLAMQGILSSGATSDEKFDLYNKQTQLYANENGVLSDIIYDVFAGLYNGFVDNQERFSKLDPDIIVD